jgi:hypothetical protein
LRGRRHLQIFTSKMAEGRINFLKTGKTGRVGYEVRQRVNECAPKNKRSHVFGSETDFATNAPDG